MKYSVTRFPDYTGNWGSPWQTNSWFLSRIYAWIYWFQSVEVRINGDIWE